AGILRVISGSPTDVQPMLDAIVEQALRIAEADNASILRLDGDELIVGARVGPQYAGWGIGSRNPLPPARGGPAAIRERRTIHVVDTLGEDGARYPDVRDLARDRGVRTVLAVPLLREGVPIGALSVNRTVVRPFTPAQIAVLETFADQAVIA